MKKRFVGHITLLLIAGFLTVTKADVIFLGVFDGNDSQVGLETLEDQINTAEDYLGNGGQIIDLSFYDKVEEPDLLSNLMTVTYNEDNMTGTWTTEQPIDFYIVKGGPQYSIWWIQESATSGTWTTDGLINKGDKQPEISHLSAYNDQFTSVPEPAALSLLGLSILTIIGLNKRRTI